jgi:hypothetical protein
MTKGGTPRAQAQVMTNQHLNTTTRRRTDSDPAPSLRPPGRPEEMSCGFIFLAGLLSAYFFAISLAAGMRR